ncbi:MAG: ferredoxin--NADP reductase, partial [Myxococcota bacterium]
RHRRPGTLDAAAALAARALPKRWGGRIDQARLDARMILDRARGRTASPLIDELSAPTSLDDVELLELFPRSVAERMRTTGRDLAMLRDRLILGKTPPPLIERPRAAPGDVVSLPREAPTMARTVKVVDVVRETEDAISVYLTEDDGSPIGFKPGQFLSVDVEVEGETHRRAYSIASPCILEAPVHVTVKRIADGRVSNHLNDSLRAGDTLSVLGPSGNFTVKPHALNERHLVMMAGGSGITPIMCLLETVLREEPRSRVTLIYGNRGWQDIIFRDRLATLCEEVGDRLIVDHVLDQPEADWTGGSGLLTAEVLASRFAKLGIEDGAMVRYFVCGPTPMMDAAHEVLRARGVDGNRVFEERFTRPEDRHAETGSDKVELVVVSQGGSDHGVQVSPGQTILEAALAAGLDMPFSCAMGGCGACRVKRREGDVRMEEPNCLSRAEREQGYVLTCVGRPMTQSRIEVENG